KQRANQFIHDDYLRIVNFQHEPIRNEIPSFHNEKNDEHEQIIRCLPPRHRTPNKRNDSRRCNENDIQLHKIIVDERPSEIAMHLFFFYDEKHLVRFFQKHLERIIACDNPEHKRNDECCRKTFVHLLEPFLIINRQRNDDENERNHEMAIENIS